MKETEYHLRQTVEPGEVPEIAVELEKEGYPLTLFGPNGHGKTYAAKESVKAISCRHNDGKPMPIVNCNSGARPGVGEYGMQIFNATGYDPEDFAMPVCDTVKVKPPLSPARMGMSQGPVRSSLVMDALVRNLKKKWGRMR